MVYDYQPTAVVKNKTRHGLYMSMMIHIAGNLHNNQLTLPILLHANLTVIPRLNKKTKKRASNDALNGRRHWDMWMRIPSSI